MAENSHNKNNKKPVKTYKVGLLNLSLWENELTEGKMKSFTFQRAYTDSKGVWQHTQSLGLSDLPKLRLLIEEAYKDQVLKEV